MGYIATHNIIFFKYFWRQCHSRPSLLPRLSLDTRSHDGQSPVNGVLPLFLIALSLLFCIFYASVKTTPSVGVLSMTHPKDFRFRWFYIQSGYFFTSNPCTQTTQAKLMPRASLPARRAGRSGTTRCSCVRRWTAARNGAAATIAAAATGLLVSLPSPSTSTAFHILGLADFHWNYQSRPDVVRRS